MDRLPSDDGIDPVSWLVPRDRMTRLVRFEGREVMLPSSLLSKAMSSFRPVSPESDDSPPVSSFPCRRSSSRSVRPESEGMAPSRSLSFRRRILSSVRLLKAGMFPSSPLLFSFSSSSSTNPLRVGISPSRSFSDMSSSCSLSRLLSSSGNSSLRSFPARCSFSRLESDPILTGMLPPSSLLESSSVSSTLRSPRTVGISPLNSLSERSRSTRAVRLAKEGIAPLRPF